MSKRLSAVASLLILCGMASFADAQTGAPGAQNYYWAVSPAAGCTYDFETLNAGNSASVGTVGADDQFYGPINANISIFLFGTTVSVNSWTVSSNGVFGPTSGSSTSPTYSTLIPFGLLADDLEVGTDLIRYATLGTEPNRRFILQWDAPHLSDEQFPNRFQLKLFENSNRVEYHYQQTFPITLSINPPWIGSTAQSLSVVFQSNVVPSNLTAICWLQVPTAPVPPTPPPTPLPTPRPTPPPTPTPPTPAPLNPFPAGGPDGGGYSYRDQRVGCAVNFEDISATGTPVSSFSRFSSSSLAFLNFTFPYYGNTYTQVFVNSNGYLSFNSMSSSSTPQPWPASFSTPDIAPLWHRSDANTANGDYLVYQTLGAEPNRRFIAQWRAPTSDSATGSFNLFQVKLFENGQMEFQYSLFGAEDVGQTATVASGIQNSQVINLGSKYWYGSLAAMRTTQAVCIYQGTPPPTPVPQLYLATAPVAQSSATLLIAVLVLLLTVFSIMF